MSEEVAMSWVNVKASWTLDWPGLDWTMDWTMDWTVDCNMD